MDYEKMWSEIVGYIQSGEGDKARKIWDELVEYAKQWETALKGNMFHHH